MGMFDKQTETSNAWKYLVIFANIPINTDCYVSDIADRLFVILRVFKHINW